MSTTSICQLDLDGIANRKESDDAVLVAGTAPKPTLRTIEPPVREVHVKRTTQRQSRGSAPTAAQGAATRGVEALLTFSEADVALGISLRQFRRLVDAGKVAFVKVSERSPRVRPSELQRFLDASAVKYEVPS